MSSYLDKQPLVIASRHVISRRPSDEMDLHVLSGCVWVTIEGLAEDYWLKPGEVLCLPSGHKIVIESYPGASEIEFRFKNFRRLQAKTRYGLQLEVKSPAA